MMGDVISAYDAQDPTSISLETRERTKEMLRRNRRAGALRIGLPLVGVSGVRGLHRADGNRNTTSRNFRILSVGFGKGRWSI